MFGGSEAWVGKGRDTGDRAHMRVDRGVIATVKHVRVEVVEVACIESALSPHATKPMATHHSSHRRTPALQLVWIYGQGAVQSK